MRTVRCDECGHESVAGDVAAGRCPECGTQLSFVIRLDTVDVETLRTRVLLVDDDEHVRDVVQSYLEAQGFHAVRAAASGPDAAAIAEKFRPEIVLLDYLMPALKGDDTAKLLRKIVPGARVIAFSGALSECPQWADAYLPKSELPQAAQLIEVLRPVTVETRVSPRPGVE
ncbi:MAG: response regulator [Actinomycetota bacterium]|nr:response regulator [Actinomycetota bacterium]